MWSALNPDFFSCSGVNLQRRRCEGSSEGRESSRGWVVEEVGEGGVTVGWRKKGRVNRPLGTH